MLCDPTQLHARCLAPRLPFLFPMTMSAPLPGPGEPGQRKIPRTRHRAPHHHTALRESEIRRGENRDSALATLTLAVFLSPGWRPIHRGGKNRSVQPAGPTTDSINLYDKWKTRKWGRNNNLNTTVWGILTQT